MRHRDAVKECAKWLAYCLSAGWRRSDLVDLESIWWRYHDKNGNLLQPIPPISTPWNLVEKHMKPLTADH